MNRIKDFFNSIEEGKYSALEIVMASLILFLLGLVIGLLSSPRKNTMIGCNNGMNNWEGSDDDWEDWDFDDEELD